MKTSFILILFIIPLTHTLGQVPSIDWQKTLGGSSTDANSLVLTLDNGNSVIIGHSDSDASGDKSEDSRGDYDIWMIKLNQEGIVLWDKTIGGDLSDTFNDCIFYDNLIFILGTSWSSPSGEKTSPNYGNKDYWLLCLNEDGDVLWDLSYGGSSSDEASSLTLLSNGNLLIGGTSSSGISGNKTVDTNGQGDLWVLEVDADSGSIVQQESIGSEHYDYLVDLTEVSPNQYCLLGNSSEGASADKSEVGYGGTDAWVVLIDSTFNIVQDKCFGGNGAEYSTWGDIVTSESHLYFTSSSDSEPSGNKTALNYGGRDYWLVKTDFELSPIWDKSYGGSGNESAGSLLSDQNQQFYLTGSSNSPVSGTRTAPLYGERDNWILILNDAGDELVQESYGGLGADSGGRGTLSPDGKLAISSTSDSDASGVKTEDSRGGQDYWVLQLDTYISVEEFKETVLQLKTYPNPFVDEVYFDLSEVKGRSLLSIYSGEGKLVFSEKIINQDYIIWEPKSTEGSLFFYELRSGSDVYQGKLIKVF